MNKLKKLSMISAMMGGMLISSAGIAANAGWWGVGISSAATIAGAVLTFAFTDVLYMNWYGLPLPNIDAPQLVAEYLVMNELKNTKDKWEPEPAKEYQKAAESNGGSCSGSDGDGGASVSLTQTLAFQVASLKNVGIEAIDVGAGLDEILSARSQILNGLAYLQEKGNGSTDSSDSSDIGAGSCSAPYSVCLKEMTTEEEEVISKTQQKNEQFFATAGIAHAELGLKSVQQAIVNDGGNVAKDGANASSEKIREQLASGKSVSVQDLSGLIGTGSNTVAAQKIVALMNLELAQRLNQGNMLQGATLTIEAARALTQISTITD